MPVDAVQYSPCPEYFSSSFTLRANRYRIVFNGCLVLLYCIGYPVITSATEPGQNWLAPAPMYAVADFPVPPQPPQKIIPGGRVGRDQKNTSLPLWQLDYGDMMLPDDSGIFLLAALFPENLLGASEETLDIKVRWIIQIQDNDIIENEGPLQAFRKRGLAIEPAAHPRQNVVSAIKIKLCFPNNPKNIPRHFSGNCLPALALIRMTPAVTALPGACSGLACFRFAAKPGSNIRLARPTESHDQIHVTGENIWILEPFDRLAAISVPEAGEGITLLNRWTAELKDVDVIRALWNMESSHAP